MTPTEFTLPVSCLECGGPVFIRLQDVGDERLDAIFECTVDDCQAHTRLTGTASVTRPGKPRLAELRRIAAAEAV